MREGLHRATRSYSDTGEAALVCVSGAGGDVGEALRAEISGLAGRSRRPAPSPRPVTPPRHTDVNCARGGLY